MKKLFLLIPALVLTLALNAKEITITPTYPHSSGNNLLATLADAGTEDGDVIILADGTYNESSNYIFFDKSVEVKAADDAHPVVEVECEVRIGKNATGKNVTIRGIKFDASKQDGTGNNATSYSHFIRIYSAGTLDFENCEFYSSANKVIEVENTSSIDNLVINNCYFHDNTKSCIYIDNTVASNLTITNSTFANSPTTSKGTIFSKAAASSVIRVDHCTFYDCTTESTDYGVIGHNGYSPTDVVVSNSIFAWGTTYDKRATYLPSGTSVTNCLTYNTTKDTDKWGHHSGPTFTNCALQDPQFNDLANNKYTFNNNWVTMSISPAAGAATDGSDLGDPRWYTDPVLPSTDFATPYAFIGAKAVVSDKMELNGDNYIASTASGGTACWKINITRACAVQVTLNMSDAVVTGHNYQVEIFDADNNSIGALNEGGWRNNVDDKTLTGSIQIPATGNYKIVLTNNESGTTAVIKGITLSYIGGATINIPATLLPVDALKSPLAYVDESDAFRFTDDDHTGDVESQWAKWKLHATKGGNYKFTTSVTSPGGHSYVVSIYNADETVLKGSVTQTGDDIYGIAKTFSTDNILLEEGDYVLVVQNTTQWSKGRIVNIVATFEGGTLINIPETLEPIDAMHSSRAYVDENDELRFTDDDHSGYATEEWAKWRIHAERAGYYIFATSVKSPNGQSYTTTIYDSGETISKGSASLPEEGNYGHERTFSTDKIYLEQGDYIVKVQNNTEYSKGRIVNIVATYERGAIVNVPGQILGDDAMLCKEDGGTLKMTHLANGDIQYNNNGYNLTEYALWNIHAGAACELSVTLNIATSGHLMTVELYDGSTLLGSALEADGTKWDDGDIELADHLSIPAAGYYTIKLINRQQHSGGALHAITLTEVSVATTVTMNDTDEDNSAWVANVDGAAVNVELTRSFTGGMYNTICLPFAVESEGVEAAFGAGVELMYMSGATLDGTVLDLQFASTTSIYQGTPYLIKPVANVVNPTFSNVMFKVSDASGSATGGTDADFIGTFIKLKDIPASTDNLYLQAHNMLEYSQDAVTIKGTRAYFHVKTSGMAPIVRPRIVLNGQVLTDIELVDGEPQTNGKFIENGQLIILRDGVRYNALGIRVK